MSEDLVVILSRARVSVESGGSAEIALQVQNRGTVVDEYTVEVLGEAATWTTLDKSRVPVFPEGLGTVLATIQPPRGSFPPAGEVPVGFHVRSSVNPHLGVVEECRVDLKPFVEIGGEIKPKTAKGRFSATHRLSVINRGNAPVSVTVRAEVQQGDCDVSVGPEPLLVGIGGRSTSKVTVRPSSSHWSGADEMHSYRLKVVPERGAPIAIDAMMRQRPIASIPTAMLLAAALFLGGVYVVYWRGPNPLQQAVRWVGPIDLGQPPSSALRRTPPTTVPTQSQPTSIPSQNGSISNGPQCTLGAPSNVSATAGNALATVKWGAPPPTCVVTGYTITGSPGNTSVSASPAAVSVVVPNLTNGTTYSFVVVATGPGGSGPGSAPSNPVTPAGPPGAPVSVTATAGDATATVSWKAPASNGGAPVTSYLVQGGPLQVSVSVGATSTGGTTTLSNLVNGTSYTFTVAASNSAGRGPTAASTPVTPLCTALSSLDLTTTPYHVYWRAKGTCSPYTGTLVARYVSLFGVVTYQNLPFSASGPNPSGAVPWSAPFGTSHTSFTMTLTDSGSISVSSAITYN